MPVPYPRRNSTSTIKGRNVRRNGYAMPAPLPPGDGGTGFGDIRRIYPPANDNRPGGKYYRWGSVPKVGYPKGSYYLYRRALLFGAGRLVPRMSPYLNAIDMGLQIGREIGPWVGDFPLPTQKDFPLPGEYDFAGMGWQRLCGGTDGGIIKGSFANNIPGIPCPQPLQVPNFGPINSWAPTPLTFPANTSWVGLGVQTLGGIRYTVQEQWARPDGASEVVPWIYSRKKVIVNYDPFPRTNEMFDVYADPFPAVPPWAALPRVPPVGDPIFDAPPVGDPHPDPLPAPVPRPRPEPLPDPDPLPEPDPIAPPVPVHPRRPPGPGEKETKGYLNGKLWRGWLEAIVHGVTEIDEVADCLFGALPRRAQFISPGKPALTIIEKLRQVDKNINDVDLKKFVKCMIANQISDAILGRLGRIGKRLSGRLTRGGYWNGRPGGIQLGPWDRGGPRYYGG